MENVRRQQRIRDIAIIQIYPARSEYFQYFTRKEMRYF